MATLDGVRIFSVAGTEYVWDDVVLAAHFWGDWNPVEQRVRDGLACLARLDDVEEDGEDALDEDDVAKPLNVLRAGDGFGEMGLLEHTTRTATVRASGDVEVWRLDRHVFEELLVTWPDLKKYLELQASRRRLQNFFRFYTAFTRLPVDALGEMLGQLEPVTAAAGERVIRQGEPAGPMYIVEADRLRVFVEEEGRMLRETLADRAPTRDRPR